MASGRVPKIRRIRIIQNTYLQDALRRRARRARPRRSMPLILAADKVSAGYALGLGPLTGRRVSGRSHFRRRPEDAEVQDSRIARDPPAAPVDVQAVIVRLAGLDRKEHGHRP